MSEFSETMDEVIDEIGDTFQWNGATFPCYAGSLTESKALGFGGFALDADMVIVCTAAQFSGVEPALKDLVIHGTRTLSIDRIEARQGVLVLSCNDASKGV